MGFGPKQGKGGAAMARALNKARKAPVAEPTVTVTLAEADHVRRAIMGDPFDSEMIDSFIRKVQEARTT